jgi:PKD domain
VKSSRLSKLAALTAAGVVTALAVPALASATIYCVGSPGGVCTVSKIGTGAGLQDALTEAAQSPDADVVRIGPGTYTGSFFYSAPSEIDIQGSGAATVIQGTGQDAALDVNASGSASVVSDLTIRMASVPDPQLATGLRIGDGTGDNLRVENPGNSIGDGVVLHPGGDLVGSVIHAGAARGIGGGSSASQHEVREVYVAGTLGVEALNGTWNLERVEISARRNAVQSQATTNLRNSLVRVSGVEGKVTSAIEQLGPGALTAENVTIQGGPHLNYGVTSVIQGAGTAAVNVESSIVAGAHTSTFARYAEAGGSANIVVGHSNFAPPDQSEVDASNGPGVFQQTPNGTNTNLEPKFVDALVTLESPTVDLRLRHDSPLIDKGEPGGAQGWDLARETRIVDGDGIGNAVRDMGAHEYQRRAPTATIASPAGGVFAVGTPVAFSAEGSSDPDPGDALSYAWSFGDGASGSGAGTTHTYEAGGPRAVTLTVTDPTGLTAMASSALLVDAPPAPPTPAAGPADAIAPSMSAVSLTRSVFRVDARAAAARRVPRGTRVRFTLSEAARVRFEIRRYLRVRGRSVAFGRFERQASAGPNAVRFSGKLRLGGRTRSLPPGRYRLVLVATDSTGNRSAAKRLPFRVVS